MTDIISINISKNELRQDIKSLCNKKVNSEELELIADRIKDILYNEYSYSLDDVVNEVVK